MTRTVEILVAVVSKAEGPVAGAAGSTLIIDQYNADMKGFELVNQSAQIGAAVASVLSITNLTAGFVPFLNVNTNLLAGTTTFLKIVADYKTNNEFKKGDVIALVGNVAGVVAGITLMAGMTSVGTLFAGAALTANLFGVLSSDTVQNLYQSVAASVIDFFHENNSADAPNYWVAPDLKVVSWREIANNYSSRIAVANWTPESNSVVVGSVVFDAEDSGEDGQGGIVFGGGATHEGVLPELPEVPARVDITIESLGGVIQPGPSVPPSTGNIDITIESLNGQLQPDAVDSSDRQDVYACCNGTQDGYY